MLLTEKMVQFNVGEAQNLAEVYIEAQKSDICSIKKGGQ